MRQGNSLITLVMVVLAAVLAIYMGVYIFDTVTNSLTTTYAYAYTAWDSVEATGILVREEQVFAEQGGIIEVRRAEGEKVGKDQTVAVVYQNSEAVTTQVSLQLLSMEAEVLQYALEPDTQTATAAQLNEEILRALTALRGSVGAGDYSRLETQVMEVKSTLIKRDYTYGSGLTTQDLTARLTQISGEMYTLTIQTSSASTEIKAPVSGTYSTLADGYEGLVTPQTMYEITPAQLRELLSRSVAAPANSPGKLIQGTVWYLAASMETQAARRLNEGGNVTVRFSGDFNQNVDMTVVQVGETEGDQTAVILSSDRYMSQTTLLRLQTVEIVYQSYSGIRVPKTALRMETRTSTQPVLDSDGQPVVDSEGKPVTTSTEYQVLGVYVLTAGKAEFKPVETVMEGSDYYIVRPTSESASALRAGDEVIVRATGLYHGKLLES